MTARQVRKQQLREINKVSKLTESLRAKVARGELTSQQALDVLEIVLAL